MSFTAPTGGRGPALPAASHASPHGLSPIEQFAAATSSLMRATASQRALASGRAIDHSAGLWEAGVKTRLVRQQSDFDCGVACAAMASGESYWQALASAERLGFRDRPRPLSSNFKALAQLLQALGVRSRMQRWSGWAGVQQLGIIKVANGEKRNWHWVVAERTEHYGILVRDPARSIASLEHPPIDEIGPNFAGLELHQPYGNWLNLNA